MNLTIFVFFVCTLHPKRYTKENLWNRGCRFIHKGSSLYDTVVTAAMKHGLQITDKGFQSDCRETVGKWIMAKQDDIINNVKSPYRAKLKTCKS